jgi:hypothetical protein
VGRGRREPAAEEQSSLRRPDFSRPRKGAIEIGTAFLGGNKSGFSLHQPTNSPCKTLCQHVRTYDSAFSPKYHPIPGPGCLKSHRPRRIESMASAWLERTDGDGIRSECSAFQPTFPRRQQAGETDRGIVSSAVLTYLCRLPEGACLSLH